jgi:hypothetical protein
LASKALLLARLTLAFDAQVDRDVEPADGVAVDRDDVINLVLDAGQESQAAGLEDSSSWGSKRKGLTRKSQAFRLRNPFQIKMI